MFENKQYLQLHVRLCLDFLHLMVTIMVYYLVFDTFDKNSFYYVHAHLKPYYTLMGRLACTFQTHYFPHQSFIICRRHTSRNKFLYGRLKLHVSSKLYKLNYYKKSHIKLGVWCDKITFYFIWVFNCYVKINLYFKRHKNVCSQQFSNTIRMSC